MQIVFELNSLRLVWMKMVKQQDSIFRFLRKEQIYIYYRPKIK